MSAFLFRGTAAPEERCRKCRVSATLHVLGQAICLETEDDMKYLYLVYGEQQILAALSEAEAQALTNESLAYDEVLQRSGHLIVAQALAPVRTAKTVRVRKRKVTVTDGPFAETKEQLLGFIMIDARDLDDALAVASSIPLAHLGSIEVRAIKELSRT